MKGKRMYVKLAFLVIFASSVLALNHTKEPCKYSNRHKLTKVICSDFSAPIELKTVIPTQSNFEKLVFKNITGSLDLSNFTLNTLRFLLVSHSRLESFVLGQFPELIFLNIVKNEKFPNLTQDFFSPVTHLSWLSLVSNNHTIAPDAFQLLKNLTWLHIQNQNLEHLTGEYLKENTKLHELAIRNCRLQKIDAEAFQNLTELEILSLNYNNIKYFESGTFENLKKLKFLELHHNKLFVDFNLDQFHGSESVEILGLPSAFLKNVGFNELVSTFPNLKKVEMKKRDIRNGEVKQLIKQLRKGGIDIIGTPHDCHHSTAVCNIV